MAGGLRRKPCQSGDRADHVSFDLDRNRRGGRGSELRIECAGNPFCALRRKGRRRIEQSEIARMRDMDETCSSCSMVHDSNSSSGRGT